MNVFAKNIKNSVDLTIDDLTIEGSITFPANSINGNSIVETSINPSKLIPSGITVNNLEKIKTVVGDIIDANTADQIIQADKKLSLGLKADINNGYYGLRYDCTPTSFLHSLSYDANTASIFACASDDQVIPTGLLVGCKTTNQKAGATINKFQLGALGSLVNSAFVNIEDVRFLSMNSTANNRFKLTSLDSISIGSTLTNQGSLFINKQGNANINLVSANNEAALQLSGQDNTIYLGPVFKINNNIPNPEILRIYKSPTVSIMDFNSTSGCVSVGDNLGSTGLPYISLNVGNNNKVVKLPNMTNAQQNTFVGALSGSGYVGSTFLNTQSNRLCYVDNNNIVHQLSGAVAASGNVNNLVVESSVTPAKTGTLLVDDNQLSQNNNVYMPLNSNVELKYLEGLSGSNIQVQLDNRVTLNTTQTITSQKTFESAVNNSNNIIIKNTTSNNSSISFENNFSPDSCRIRKVNDDISFEVASSEKMKISGNNVLITNGGRYFINGVDIKDVSETLTNKTIAFGSNTLTNVASTNTNQTITGVKDYSDSSKLLVGGAEVYQKRNTTTSNPGVNNDSSQGYILGSQWFNTVTKSMWFCYDNSVGAARWRNTNLRSVTFIQYTSNNLLTLESPVYFTCDYFVYNKINIIFSTDGQIEFSLYNLSTATNLVSQNTTTSGPDVITINIPSAPYIQPPNYTFRVDMKLLSGTTMTMYAISTE